MKTVCPRCGLEGSLVKRKRSSRIYYYIIHFNCRRVEHYLGPEEYVYVTRTHVDLGLMLRGPMDARRVVEYMDALLDRLEDAMENPDLGKFANKPLAKELQAKIREWIERLETLRGKLDNEVGKSVTGQGVL